MFRFILPLSLSVMLGGTAFAQSKADLTSQMQIALKSGQADVAMEKAIALYTLALKDNDNKTAGQAAYTQGKIHEMKFFAKDAAEAFERCYEHYRTENALAQALSCQQDAGLNYIKAGKKGTGVTLLKDTVKTLETIGQEKSGLAGLVYLNLSKEVLPPKLKRRDGAEKARKDSVKYSDKALAAFEANGQQRSKYYASALFAKGLALEDQKKYEAATDAFQQAVDLYKTLPDKDADVLKNAKARLNIVKHGAGQKSNDNIHTVRDVTGKKIDLIIKRKKRVKSPKVNKNQMVDGARVKAEITLNNDGSVATIKIIESTPNAAFGEAFAKAVKTWTFTPPEGIQAEDIPPFKFGSTFSVYRR